MSERIDLELPGAAAGEEPPIEEFREALDGLRREIRSRFPSPPTRSADDIDWMALDDTAQGRQR